MEKILRTGITIKIIPLNKIKVQSTTHIMNDKQIISFFFNDTCNSNIESYTITENTNHELSKVPTNINNVLLKDKDF